MSVESIPSTLHEPKPSFEHAGEHDNRPKFEKLDHFGFTANSHTRSQHQHLPSPDYHGRQFSETTLAHEEIQPSGQTSQTSDTKDVRDEGLSGVNKDSVYTTKAQIQTLPTSINLEEKGDGPKPRIEPEGGLGRWVQVIASLLAYANTSGLLNAYGVWQAVYARELLSDEPESRIAWIGSMQGFAMFTIAILTGPLIDMGHLRYVTAAGAFLITFGLCMASIATEFWQLILAQGLVVGMGSGCFFLPAVSIPPQWFPENMRTTVVGIVATGTVLGGVVYPVVFYAIYDNFGLGWATRVIGLIILPMNIFSSLVLRMRVVPMVRRELFSKTVLTNKAFWISSGLFFFGMSVVYVPIQFLTQYAESFTDIPPKIAQYMIPIILAGSLPGRLIPDIMADRWGVLNLVIPCVLICAVLCFCWIAVGASVGGIIVFGIFYGFFSGAWMSMLPMIVIATTGDFDRIGSRLGMGMFIAACGILAGTPIAGAILNNTHSYLGMQIFAGVLSLVGAGFMIWLRCYRVGWKWTKI